MSNVTLTIGGKSFSVACAEGEEAHVAALGRMIDGKIASMGDTAAQNETQMLLFASLLLADELEDLRAKQANAAKTAIPESEATARKIDAIALRLENLANRLEG